VGARVSEQARLRYRLSDRLALTGSAAQEFETLDLALDHGQRQRARRAVSRGAASGTFSLTRTLELNALAALEYHGTRSFDATDVVEPTARAGARLSLDHGITLLGNVGRYVRVPALGELYGVSPVVLGNPDLTPERGVSIDLGGRVAAALDKTRLFLEVFAFSRFSTALISYRRSSLNAVKPFNTTSARSLGVEVSLGAHYTDRLRAELALTAIDPRDTSNEFGPANTLLPYQAQLVAAPSIELGQGPIPALALDRAALGARLNYRSVRRADPRGVFPRVPAQTTLDLDLTLLFARRRISAALRVANVLDAPSFDVLGLPLPGRSVHGSMEVWW
jgi:iron complex outermembrane receptor protein